MYNPQTARNQEVFPVLLISVRAAAQMTKPERALRAQLYLDEQKRAVERSFSAEEMFPSFMKRKNEVFDKRIWFRDTNCNYYHCSTQVEPLQR